MYDEYGHWHDVYSYHMGGLFDGILLLVAVFGIVYLIQFVLKKSPEDPKKIDSAMDTLKKRYAAGEIDAEEFSQKKKDLES